MHMFFEYELNKIIFEACFLFTFAICYLGLYPVEKYALHVILTVCCCVLLFWNFVIILTLKFYLLDFNNNESLHSTKLNGFLQSIRICPICQAMFSILSFNDQQFEEHVQAHIH